MLRWYPNLLLQVILWLTFLPIAFFTTFVLNAAVDQKTPWSIGILKGPGLSSDFWIIFVLLIIGWSVIFLGWRGAKTAFKFLLLLWHTELVVCTILLVINPGDLFMQGESLGFSISLELLGPVFTIATLILSIIWLIIDIRRGTKNRSVSPFQKRNKIALLCAALGLVISALAFWLDFEQFGTIIGILVTFALQESFRPVNPSKELHKALFAEGSAPQ